MKQNASNDEKPERYHLRDYLLSALFPPRCHLCGERFNPCYNDGENVFFGEEPVRCPYCFDCTQTLSRLYHPIYRRMDEDTVHRWLFDYNEETVQKLIFHIKFCNCPACHAFVGKSVTYAIRKFCPDAEAVVGIPRSVPLMKKYAFDQTEKILEQYSEMPNGVPIIDALYRDPNTSQEQKGLSFRERRFNAFRSLRLRDGIKLPKSVCVLDDIVTTGSTAEAAAYLLRKGGAQKLSFLFLTAAEKIEYDEEI